MGKKRPLGDISAAKKFAEIRQLVEENNPGFYNGLMLLSLNEALVQIAVEYEAKFVPPVTTRNELANRILVAVKKYHKLP